jgi:hypothetical protein
VIGRAKARGLSLAIRRSTEYDGYDGYGQHGAKHTRLRATHKQAKR